MVKPRKEYKELQKELAETPALDIAQQMPQWTKQDRTIASRLLSKDKLAKVFQLLPSDIRQDLLENYSDKETAELIARIESDDLVDTLQELPANLVTDLLAYVEPEKRAFINQMLNYPEESVGALMSIDYVHVPLDAAYSDMIEAVRESSGGQEHVGKIYVLDQSRVLLGYLYLSDVIQHPEMTSRDLIRQEKLFVLTNTDQEKAAYLFSKYKLQSLPVVDSEERLVGIVTADDILDVIHEEREEDISLMAGIQRKDGSHYLDAPVKDMVKERIGWLLILMISAVFTGLVIQKYEAMLASHVILAAYIPMLMDSGGNAGSQSSTLVTRALSLNELDKNNLWQVVSYEFKIGLVTGLILSLINFLRLALFDQVALTINLTVGLTLIATVILSKVIGGVLPMVAERFNQDPAVMAGPLITTLVDTFTLLLYFQIASMLLSL